MSGRRQRSRPVLSHHPVQGKDSHGALLSPTPGLDISSWSADMKSRPAQLDAGQHPAYDGLAALPFFDDFDLSTVDVLLISQ